MTPQHYYSNNFTLFMTFYILGVAGVLQILLIKVGKDFASGVRGWVLIGDLSFVPESKIMSVGSVITKMFDDNHYPLQGAYNFRLCYVMVKDFGSGTGFKSSLLCLPSPENDICPVKFVTKVWLKCFIVGKINNNNVLMGTRMAQL